MVHVTVKTTGIQQEPTPLLQNGLETEILLIYGRLSRK